MPIINADNISFGYDRTIFENASFFVERGSIVLLCGESGSGKTTLLRLLKKELFPKGKCSKNIENMEIGAPSHKIGFVFQSPENQFIYDNVFEETAFGLINAGLDTNAVKQRICEFSNFLGTSGLMKKSVCELSGGEKQSVCLTSVIAMKPEILLLDEPASLLDPIAKKELINSLKKIRDEYGTTIIISEHCLENILPHADSILCINDKKIHMFDNADDFINYTYDHCKKLIPSLPDSARIGKILGLDVYPLTVGSCDSPDFTAGLSSCGMISQTYTAKSHESKKPVYSCKNLSYGYVTENDILDNISLKLYPGRCTIVTGGNASGKTTLLKIIAGIIRHKKSKIAVSCCYIPQNPISAFFKDNILEDYNLMMKNLGISHCIMENVIQKHAFFRGIDRLFSANPYDLSGGELQLCAIFKSVLSGAGLILLDEPEKGLDGCSRAELASLIRSLKNDGITFVVATHDMNFASCAGDDAIMLFNGEIIKNENIRDFILSNDFFTTDTCKITRTSIRAVNCGEVLHNAGININ